MALWLNAKDRNFESAFSGLLATKREVSEDVDQIVRDILSDVSARGDAALLDYTQKFDRFALTAATLRISAGEIAAARAACTPEALAALDVARARILAFHQRQIPQDMRPSAFMCPAARPAIRHLC